MGTIAFDYHDMLNSMFRRLVRLPERPRESFFLWGPRQTGKSTLLKALYPQAIRIDLARTEEFVRYSERPALLREELEHSPPDPVVVIDEIQKVAPLLDEVRWLVENRGRVFAMAGSSARSVRQSAPALSPGRVARFDLFGLTSAEIGRPFDLCRMLNHGYLPRHYLAEAPARPLRAYVESYLKEEALLSGLTRSLRAFSGFLTAVALTDAELVNYATIARECGVSAPTAREYFQVLVDTLLGRFLPAFTKRPKRRVIGAPKFFLADVGMVNTLTRRGPLAPGSELFGKAFENWIFHELTAASHYRERYMELSYWRLASGIEVDFVIGDMRCAIEAKAVARITSDHLKGLRQLVVDQPGVRRRVVASLEPSPRVTEDGIEILPWRVFLDRLWSGEFWGE
jgi:predicted AAA+ superfamily ATPase